jgi:alpha-tubulin suppressor-like RCC1 family protein
MIGTLTVQDNVSERFDVATAGIGTTVSISNATLTLNPAIDLGIGGTSYYVLFPANAIQDSFGTSDSVGISSYYFETAAGGGGSGYELWVVGMDTYGNLAQNTESVPRSSPIQIPGTNWSEKSGGSNTIENNNRAVIQSDGTLWVWGYGGNGGNGQNNVVDYSSPVQIPGTQWSSLSNWGTKLATKTDGTLWGWGANGNGRLGLNDTVKRSSPTQIPGTQWGTSIKQSSQGNDHCGNIKTDGTLWHIGDNNKGSLGQNDQVQRSSPTQIPGTQWNKICMGQRHSLATKTDGTLWAWGEDGNGEMGVNTRSVNRSSPVQIPGTQWDADSIDCSLYSNSALKTDGTLWVWGYNSNGQFGLNDVISRSSPTQLPGTQWTTVGGSLYYRALLKSDGTVWATGWNTNGGLGQNDTVKRSSPVQIPGTQWKFISKAYQSLQLWKEV